MSFHTVAFSTTVALADGLKALSPVTDTVFAPSGNGFLLPADLRLIAAFTGSQQIWRARVNAPSLVRVGYPSVRPVQPAVSTALSGTPAANPSLMTLLDSPIGMRGGEAVGVDAATQNASSERTTAVLWFADRLEPVPPGDSFWLRYTSSRALTAHTWTVITPSFDQAFPSGVYAVIGLEFTSPGAVAARIVFPGSVFRPGVLAQVGSIATGATNAGNARSQATFYDGSLGIFGTFQTSAPPSIEVLSVSADTADTQEGYLRVVRVGDVGVAPMAAGPLMPALNSATSYASAGGIGPTSSTKGR